MFLRSSSCSKESSTKSPVTSQAGNLAKQTFGFDQDILADNHGGVISFFGYLLYPKKVCEISEIFGSD